MVGGKRIEWQAKDIFTLPHNQAVTHCAGSTDTVLFQVTDREILKRLELLREA
jgi:gentisate 1,2-dioxygenase